MHDDDTNHGADQQSETGRQHKGIPLREALQRYSDPQEWKEFDELDRQGYGGPQVFVLGGPETESNRKNFRYRALEEKLITDLTDRLSTGTLQATGYDSRQSLDSPRVVVPPDLWPFLEIDYDASLVKGHEFSISGVLITGPTPAPRPTISVEHRCRDWVIERAKAEHNPQSKKELFADARKKFGVALSESAFLRVWKSYAPEHWKKPGRKSMS